MEMGGGGSNGNGGRGERGEGRNGTRLCKHSVKPILARGVLSY